MVQRHLLTYIARLSATVVAVLVLSAYHLVAQTTITTTFTNNNGFAAVTFNFANNNTYPIIITDIGSVLGSTGTVSTEAWYNTTPVNTATSPTINATNGWVQFGTSSVSGVSNTTTTTAQSLFSTPLSLTIPASTTYGICIGVGSAYTLRYSTLTTTGSVLTSGGGCDIIVGTNIGWGGAAVPGPLVNNPRGFIGYVTFSPANTPCAGTPTTPVITTPVHVKCFNTPDTLVATGSSTATTGISYQWEQSLSSAGPFSGVVGGSGATSLTYYTPALSTTTYYRLKSTCSNSLLFSYSAVYKDSVSNPALTSVTGGARCSTGTVALSAAGSGTGISWYTAQTGGTALAFGSPFTTPSISSTTVYYVAASLAGCEGTRSPDTAKVNPLPTATATNTNSVFQCTGGTTNLSANTGTGLTYQWQSSGINVTGATSQTYAATATGSYRVVITNTGTGCTNTSAAIAVAVGAPPSSLISPSGSAGYCPGGTVTLSTTTGTGLTYQWYLNGSAISGATNATYAAGTAGSYTVNVSAGGSCNSTTVNPTAVSAYNVSPATTNTPNGTGVCPGNVTLIDAGLISNSTYQWSLNGTAITGAIGSSYSAPSAGSYTVAVTNTNSGCVAVSAPVIITGSPVPVSTASLVSANNQCDSVQLTANTGAGLTYQWRQNTALLGGAINQNYAATASGSYAVTTTNTFGCSATSSPVVVVVNASPASNINATGPTTFCQGGIVQLQTNGNPGLTYQWYRGGAAITGATSNFIIASTAGNYTVKVTSSNGCNYTTSPAVIVVNPLPIPVVTFNPTNYLLSVTGGPYTSYSWYYNNQQLMGVVGSTYSVAAPGSYMVSATDGNGCAGFSQPVYVSDTTHIPNGVNNVSLAGAIKLYPNPGSGIVHIESPIAVQITLRDIQGRLLIDEKNVKQINIGELSKGMYLVLISDLQGHVIKMEKLTKTD